MCLGQWLRWKWKWPQGARSFNLIDFAISLRLCEPHVVAPQRPFGEATDWLAEPVLEQVSLSLGQLPMADLEPSLVPNWFR